MSQSNSIFIWREPADWNLAVSRFLRDCVPADIKSAIEADSRGYFYSNQIEWLDDQPVRYDNKQEIIGLKGLLSEFENTYAYIRVFHACRPENISTYTEAGFVPLNENAIIQKATELFLSPQCSQVTSQHIDEAIKTLQQERRQNKLYFCLDDEELIAWTGHYLIYGSEYLLALAAELSRKTGDDVSSILHNTGIPTVFVCDIPYSFIPKHLAVSLVIEIIIRTIDAPYILGEPLPSIDFTFEFTRPVPANVILTHYHPAEIPNRIGGSVYKNSQLTCPFC